MVKAVQSGQVSVVLCRPIHYQYGKLGVPRDRDYVLDFREVWAGEEGAVFRAGVGHRLRANDSPSCLLPALLPAIRPAAVLGGGYQTPKTGVRGMGQGRGGGGACRVISVCGRGRDCMM